MTFSIYGQDLKIGNNYFFKAEQGITTNKKMKLFGTKALPIDIEIKKNHKIKIIDIVNDSIYFKYLLFSKPNDTLSVSIKKEKNYYVFNEDITSNNTKIFSLKKDEFEKLTQTLYNRFRGFKYGAYTVPIRLRKNGDKFEFNSNLSLGANIIGRFGLRTKEHLFIDFSFGVGLTKVDLNKENSILGTIGSDFEKIDVLSPTAFTITFGALFNLAENVNIGAYWGWDKLSSADNKAQWVYNNKPWLGIGLNVGFSGKAKNSSGNQSQ